MRHVALSTFLIGYTRRTLSMTASLTSCKPRILCLHGYYQNASIFSNKIAGARRKIEREYDLHFLDGPILLPPLEIGDTAVDEFGTEEPTSLLSSLPPRGWWCKSETGDYSHIHEAFEYIAKHVKEECVQYDAIIGFSQGGTLATALAVSGILGPNLRAVVTAGSPYNQQVFQIALELQSTSPNDVVNGFDNVPKLHFAGSTDALVSMESTSELCRSGGSGKLIVHDQGHLFPTRSARVKEVLDFLDVALSCRNSGQSDGIPVK
jgi:hypothetical protein